MASLLYAHRRTIAHRVFLCWPGGAQTPAQGIAKLPLPKQAFHEWLSNRRLRQEGETYADELGRMTEAVNRRIPQLRYAPAERAGVQRTARDVAAGRNTSDSQVYGGML